MRTSFVFLCASVLACSPLQQQTTERLSSASGVPCASVVAASSQSLVKLEIRDLPKGKYAVFTSRRAPFDTVALRTLDLDQACAPYDFGDGVGLVSDPVTKRYEWAPCVAEGVFGEGTDGRFAIVSITADSSSVAQVTVSSPEEYISVLALDERSKLTAPITLTAFSEGSDTFGSDAPIIRVVTVNDRL